jgi:hypothetical protein
VGAWFIAATVLLVGWIAVVCARRRAARREVAARARARLRRQRVPLVSANVRGQSTRKPDIWREERESVEPDERVA